MSSTTLEAQINNDCAYASDIETMLQCQCWQTLQEEDDVMKEYINSVNQYHDDNRAWFQYKAQYDVWSKRLAFAMDYLKSERCPQSHYLYGSNSADNLTAQCNKDCTDFPVYNMQWQYEENSWGNGGTGNDDTWNCRLKDDYLQDKKDDFINAAPAPIAVPSPPPPEKYIPPNITCCSEVFSNIYAEGAKVSFSDIKQKCSSVIHANLESIQEKDASSSQQSSQTSTQTSTATSSATTTKTSSPSSSTSTSTASTTPTSSPTKSEDIIRVVLIALGVVLFLIGLFFLEHWLKSNSSPTSSSVGSLPSSAGANQ